MAIELKSGLTTDLLTIDSISKAARVTLYDSAGNPVNYSEAFRGVAATFRTLGSAAVPQNIFTIENLSGSGKLVYIRGLYLACDMTAALLTVACQVDLSRTTAIPSGGTALTKAAIDTLLSSNANVILRGATASDGGTATAITATAAAGYIGRLFIPRQATAVGQVMQQFLIDLLPGYLIESDSVLLRENQAIVVQITGTAASNAATNFYIVTCVWDEV
jgi:hypothetical protein